MIWVNLACEDDLSEFVMVKLLDSFEGRFGVHQTYSKNGFGYLKSNVKGFSEASASVPFFLLTDLDRYNCPMDLRKEWMDFIPHPRFIFRIAVREVESWLLADREGLASYFGVSITNFPDAPDLLEDPKQELIALAGRSRKREIKEDIVPRRAARIGPNYNGRLMEFVNEHWDIARALTRSESLSRAHKHLERFI